MNSERMTANTSVKTVLSMSSFRFGQFTFRISLRTSEM